MPSRHQHALALLVQPDRDDREMYMEFLDHEGMGAICVSSARQAMTVAPIADVIVTGLRLPGDIDGIEFITWLRRDSRTKGIPIVVLTACAWNTERESAEIAGCDVFLSKPCLPDELLRQLRRLMASSKGTEASRATPTRRRSPDDPKLISPSSPTHLRPLK